MSQPRTDHDTTDLSTGLRAAVSAFVDAAGQRRVLPTVFHVGRPGGRPEEQWAVLDDPRYDLGFRADLVAQGLDALGFDAPGFEDPCPWLTRAGELAPTDVDLVWFAASRLAFARLGLVAPGFFVVTRKGWLNLATADVVPVTVRRRRRRPPKSKD